LPNTLPSFPGLPFLGMGEDIPVTGPTVPTTPKATGPVEAGQAAGDYVRGKIAGLFTNAFSGIFNSTQIVTGLLGLILIAGGIFLFKPVQQVAIGAAKTAAKAAA